MTFIDRTADEPGQTLFAQLTQHLALTKLRRCVDKNAGELKVKSATRPVHGLRAAHFPRKPSGIEASLRALIAKLNHMGMRAAR